MLEEEWQGDVGAHVPVMEGVIPHDDYCWKEMEHLAEDWKPLENKVTSPQ